jgi:hypothetical protein
MAKRDIPVDVWLSNNGMKAGVRKVTAAQKNEWLETIRRIQNEITECGFPRNGSPLEEAYYNLDQAVERLREVRVGR